jgi:endoribonuclease LACTB2
VSDVIISHWHRDHVNGLPSVLALFRRLWTERNPSPPTGVTYRPPRLHKHPYIGADPEASAVSAAYNSLPDILQSLPPADFTPSPTGQPFHDLHDGQIIGGMKVAHTPGHTTDSVTLFLPEDRALYTADTVLGQGTAVFEDLADYISSLRKMLEGIRTEGSSIKLYPGHGPVVDDGAGRIEMYITHRLQREEGIVEVLRTNPATNNAAQDNGSQQAAGWTVEDLVANIYAAYPRNLWGPAGHSIGLHLKKLEKEGRVERTGNSWKIIN